VNAFTLSTVNGWAVGPGSPQARLQVVYHKIDNNYIGITATTFNLCRVVDRANRRHKNANMGQRCSSYRTINHTTKPHGTRTIQGAVTLRIERTLAQPDDDAEDGITIVSATDTRLPLVVAVMHVHTGEVDEPVTPREYGRINDG